MNYNRAQLDLQLFSNAGTLVNASAGYVNADTGDTASFTSDTTLAAEMKDFYSTELLENTRPRLIFGQFGRHVKLPAHHKGSIEFRRWKTFTRGSRLNEAQIPAGQKIGVTTVTGSVSQYGTYVSISDKLELRAYDDVIGAATREMAASLAATSEALTRDALLTGTNVLYCDNVDKDTGEVLSTPVSCSEMQAGGTVNRAAVRANPGVSFTDITVNADSFAAKAGGPGSYAFTYGESGWTYGEAAATLADWGIALTGTPAAGDGFTVKLSCSQAWSLLTPAMINRAVTVLRQNNVPAIGSEYAAIINPSVAHDLRASEGWQEAHKYAAAKQLFNGEIGSLMGVRFIENASAPILGVTGTTAEDDDDYVNASRGRTYATYFLGDEAFAIVDPEGGGAEMIVHDKDEIGGPLNQFSTIGYKFETNGATILYPERCLRVMSCSAFSGTDSVN